MSVHGESYKVIAHFGEALRAEIITVGKVYIVRPLNPAKAKHRDRTCTVLSFKYRDKEDAQIQAVVRFHDNHRLGQVEPDDLVALENAR